MRRYGLFRLIGVCALCVLTACSGGNGGNGGNGDSEDREGAAENTVRLTIEGKVVDGPVSNAQIDFVIGDTQVSTESDSKGNYSIAIEVLEGEAENIVKAVAYSPDNGRVEFVSLMGSITSLVEYAGEDGVLEQSEHYAVNISSISTSISALLEEGSNSEVNSESSLQKALKKIDAERAFSTAASIKFMLEYSEKGISLPSDIQTTYGYAKSFELSAKYVSMMDMQFSELFNDIKAGIVNDTNLVSLFPNQITSVADTYYFDSLESQLTLSEDGTGVYSYSGGSIDLNWFQETDGIRLDFKDSIFGMEETIIDGESIYTDLKRKPSRLFWMLDGKTQGIMVIEVSDTLSYPYHDDIPESTKVRYIADTAVRSAGLLNPKDVLLIGRDYSFPTSVRNGEVVDSDNSDAVLYFTALSLKLSGDFENGGSAIIKEPTITGSGERAENLSSGEWIVDDKNRLIINLSDGSQFIYSLLNLSEKDEVIFSSVLTKSENDEDKALFDPILLKQVMGWTDNDVIGQYSGGSDFHSPLSRYLQDFKADGTMDLDNSRDSNGNGVLEDSEITKNTWRWKLSDNGNLLIREYKTKNRTDCLPEIWDTEDGAECVLYRAREWELYQVDKDNRYWFKQYLDSFSDYQRETLSGIDDPGGHLLLSGYIMNTNREKFSSVK
ncbi:hypothetical protein ACCI51_12190 [Microbulbifer echini]|uniref:Carboxypeptidase regulatory-like domain-containing protein n=1 Tax=Microbulbifer echini TaxID=1529067 RepID=A0ABV4NP37_9GAMM